eukprot:Gregarina_sp_Poly_1__3712@NODE_2099_length_2686_cov_253_893471_g1354_i0_p1_GENE_NODE_2099_length_2686_cov_253_893471_g1354_i0NODE_2099_length_2686_cov_253_893471_g1354_i0_p1_ORF_typecomplete_len411_score65_28PIN_6/PF17146_4/4_9e18PIN_6/PF17146_4/1_7e02NOB1_Zn_bind/PF08772_11/2_3e12Cript/PF10235_9/0_021DUF35_N/PF12172_8/0_56DZR/PF12773_7/1_6_NODE_2099_length_2686_cov_253_893471_g1354_i02891521
MQSAIVVDTGAILRHASFFDPNVSYFSPSCIIQEVQDKQGREHFERNFHYLKIDEPEQDDEVYVKKLARLTGDLPHLSIADIKVIALSVKQQRMKNLPLRSLEEAAVLLDAPDIKKHSPKNAKTNPTKPSVTTEIKQLDSDVKLDPSPSGFEAKDEVDTLVEPMNKLTVQCETELKLQSAETRRADVNVSVTEGSTVYDFDDGEGKWVTSENFEDISSNVNSTVIKDAAPVSCMTGDFAMQNVLFVIGIPIVTPDGKRIKSIRRWVQICSACKTVVKTPENPFCHACGYASLRRAPMIKTASGKDRIFLRDRRPNLKGTIFKPPTVLGGKYAEKTVLLTEDMLYMGGRDREQRHREKLRQKQLAGTAWESWTTTDSLGSSMNKGLFKEFQVEYGRGNRNSNRYQKRQSKR